MKIFVKSALAIVAISLVIFGACSLRKEFNTSAHELSVPLPTNYTVSGLLWLPDGRLIILLHGASDPRSIQHYMIYGENDVYQLPLGDDPKCTRNTEYASLSVLPDRRLGLIELCGGRHPDRPISKQDESYLLAYDWNTNEVEQIVAGSLPNDNLSRDYTWNPTMTRGIQEFTGLVGTIYWITPLGVEPMAITVADGRRSWSLDENFESLKDQKPSSHTGIARAPAWSPDGKAIAFLSNLDAIGQEGIYRSSGEWNLYLMDPAELIPRKIVGGIYDPANMVWSPDSRWLAIVGEMGIWRQDGLWLFSPKSGKLVLAAKGQFHDMDWSPDSTEIVTLLCTDDTCQEEEIWKYDVSKTVLSDQ